MKKHYKDNVVYLGYSDISTIQVVGLVNNVKVKFAEDGSYRAYIVEQDGSIEIPAHYKKIGGVLGKALILDDSLNPSYIDCDLLRIYRAGSYGCILEVYNLKDTDLDIHD